MEELQGWTAALEGGKGHALKVKLVEEFSSFWSSSFQAAVLQAIWAFSFTKKFILIIHLRKKEFMGFFFFMLLINSFSGDFSDGVPAGGLDLG